MRNYYPSLTKIDWVSKGVNRCERGGGGGGEKEEDNITGLPNLNEIILSLLKKRKNTDDVRRV